MGTILMLQNYERQNHKAVSINQSLKRKENRIGNIRFVFCLAVGCCCLFACFLSFFNYFYVCLILIVAVVVVAKAEDKC